LEGKEMEGFEIQPILSSGLPDVAGFLHRWRGNEANGSSVQHYVREDTLSIERRLKWLLLENPVATEGTRLGYCLRDRLGVIRGLNLAIPAAFLSADQRLLCLCSGSFFVEPPARPLGLYLFRKYLGSPGYSFFFSTTCNAQSGELWRKLGGCAVPNSEIEYVLPLRLDVMIPAIVDTMTSSDAVSGIARICGRFANPILRLITRPSAKLAIEPSQDWEKLSELSRRYRSPSFITGDRSAEFLRWRYGSASPLYPCGIYLFRDNQGNEGWFSLGNVLRGGQQQICGSILLDAIWPREKMSFRGILEEILRLAASRADAIFFRPRPGVDYREYSPWIIPRRLETPRVFVMMRKGAPSLDLNLFDYDDSDDSAWSFQWPGARGRSDLFPRESGGMANRSETYHCDK
jgi:hypothetical protein